MHFDYAVATEKMGLPELPWERLHDTLFLLFLENPYNASLALKPSAQLYLNMPPEEQDAVHDWLMEHKRELGIGAQEKAMGKYIALAPGDLVGKYAIGDVVRTRKLFDLLYPRIVERGMLPAYDVERELMPILLANEQEGVRVDLEKLEIDRASYEVVLGRCDDWLCKRLKTPGMNLDSGEQLADALGRTGIVTNFAQTKTGKRSTAKGTLTLNLFSDPKVYRALAYRSKLAYSLSTFIRPWLNVSEQTGGTIHTHWNQTARFGAGAVTGRMSSNPNFQNLTSNIQEEDGGSQHPKFLAWAPSLPSLRRYILPDAGQLVGLRDVSQEELKILAHYEGGPLMAAYLEDPSLDVHNMVQVLLANAGRELDRKKVKATNFSILYGSGGKGLSRRLGVELNTAFDIIKKWKEVMPGVSQLIKDIKEEVHSGGVIATWGGRQYGMPPPLWEDGEERPRDYVLLNYLIQGSGADLLKKVIIEFHKRKVEARIMMTIHDELEWSCPEKVMRKNHKVLKDIIADLEFDVPMSSDGKVGKNLGDAEKVSY